MREFSAEVFKKVEKCKDELLRSDEAKTSKEEENGEKLGTENDYEESVDAHVVKEG